MEIKFIKDRKFTQSMLIDGKIVKTGIAYNPRFLIDQRPMAAIDKGYEPETDEVICENKESFNLNYDFINTLYSGYDMLKKKYPLTYKGIRNVF